MRTLLLLLVSLLLLSVVYQPSSGLDKDLVAYFRFNHCDGRDASGMGSYARFVGGVGCWCGVEDEGVQFDGRTGHLVFEGPINNYFTTSDLTISFYLKPEAHTAFLESLLGKRESCGEEFALDLFHNFNRQEITTIFQESEFKYFKDLSPALPDGRWFHVALVRQGIYARTYINGKLVRESRRCSGVDISNTAPLSFSDSPCITAGRARRFKGVLDELRIYDRALTDEEIEALYLLIPIENIQMDCVS
ncbi:MAG: LamG domain-containing protein [Bacteroidetes bacterium]|nr:MAG: LamG domain-containing protein [Bacteroidota bacterium]